MIVLVIQSIRICLNTQYFTAQYFFTVLISSDICIYIYFNLYSEYIHTVHIAGAEFHIKRHVVIIIQTTTYMLSTVHVFFCSQSTIHSTVYQYTVSDHHVILTLILTLVVTLILTLTHYVCQYTTHGIDYRTSNMIKVGTFHEEMDTIDIFSVTDMLNPL